MMMCDDDVAVADDGSSSFDCPCVHAPVAVVMCAPGPVAADVAACAQELPCGHFMHSSCFLTYTRYNYTCPLCCKSVGDMSVYFQMLDSLLAAERLPPEYAGRMQQVGRESGVGRMKGVGEGGGMGGEMGGEWWRGRGGGYTCKASGSGQWPVAGGARVNALPCTWQEVHAAEGCGTCHQATSMCPGHWECKP